LHVTLADYFEEDLFIGQWARPRDVANITPEAVGRRLTSGAAETAEPCSDWALCHSFAILGIRFGFLGHLSEEPSHQATGVPSCSCALSSATRNAARKAGVTTRWQKAIDGEGTWDYDQA